MMRFDVFISYPHQEKTTADAVCATLEAAAIRCWIAPRDVPAGTEWADAIVNAIDHCKAMVLVFSSHTNASRQIRREVQRAFDQEKPVMPVRIENVAPESGLAYYMGPVHWLDAFTPPLEQHLQHLQRSVEALVKSAASPERPEPDGARTEPAKFSAAGLSKNPEANAPTKLTATRTGRWLGALAISACIVALLCIAGISTAINRHWFATEKVPDLALSSGSNPQIKNPDAGSVPGGLAATKAAANRGDAASENALGIKYAEGLDGLQHDDTKAVEWYLKSALQGNASAETNVGDMYFFGRGGLSKSYSDALSWYLKAAQQNWPDAQYRLAVMYEKGLGTSTDAAHAVQLYKSAADQGYPDAQNELGVLYAVGGDGLTEDDKQAVMWYQKSAAQGYARAEKNLGDMYFFGRGVGQDYPQAFTWYQKAASGTCTRKVSLRNLTNRTP
jgi:TIR domain/Sel1 repeat